MSTPASHRVLVVVPAWNECGSVAAVVREIKSWVCADVLVVDDGSTDDTAALAAGAGAMVCRMPFNLGVGGAVRTGFRYALEMDYDVVVQVDADGQHDPSYIPRLLEALASCDVVVGARFAGEGAYRARGPRRWAMRLLATTLSGLAHESLSDVTSGFRATNRNGIKVFAAHYPAEYLGDTVESLVIAMRSGCTVRQVPVSMRLRKSGVASQSPARASVYLVRAGVALGLAMVRRWPLGLDPAPEELA